MNGTHSGMSIRRLFRPRIITFIPPGDRIDHELNTVPNSVPDAQDGIPERREHPNDEPNCGRYAGSYVGPCRDKHARYDPDP